MLQTTIDIGRARPQFIGDYDAAATYQPFDCVRNNSQWWINPTATALTGITPQNGSVWVAYSPNNALLTSIKSILLVTALPSTPDPDILYLIEESIS